MVSLSEAHRSSWSTDVLLILHLSLLNKLSTSDKKFAVKARLSGILLIVVGLVKKYPEDQEKLNIILKLLQAVASSNVNAESLGKLGCLTILVKILTKVGQKDYLIMKHCVGVLTPLLKQKVNAGRPAAQTCVKQLVLLHEQLHHTDTSCRHILLRKKVLNCLKTCICRESNLQVFNKCNGLQVLYATAVQCSDGGRKTSRNIASLTCLVLRKCLHPVPLPLVLLKNPTPFSLPVVHGSKETENLMSPSSSAKTTTSDLSIVLTCSEKEELQHQNSDEEGEEDVSRLPDSASVPIPSSSPKASKRNSLPEIGDSNLLLSAKHNSVNLEAVRARFRGQPFQEAVADNDGEISSIECGEPATISTKYLEAYEKYFPELEISDESLSLDYRSLSKSLRTTSNVQEAACSLGKLAVVVPSVEDSIAESLSELKDDTGDMKTEYSMALFRTASYFVEEPAPQVLGHTPPTKPELMYQKTASVDRKLYLADIGRHTSPKTLINKTVFDLDLLMDASLTARKQETGTVGSTSVVVSNGCDQSDTVEHDFVPREARVEMSASEISQLLSSDSKLQPLFRNFIGDSAFAAQSSSSFKAESKEPKKVPEPELPADTKSSEIESSQIVAGTMERKKDIASDPESKASNTQVMPASSESKGTIKEQLKDDSTSFNFPSTLAVVGEGSVQDSLASVSAGSTFDIKSNKDSSLEMGTDGVESKTSSALQPDGVEQSKAQSGSSKQGPCSPSLSGAGSLELELHTTSMPCKVKVADVGGKFLEDLDLEWDAETFPLANSNAPQEVEDKDGTLRPSSPPALAQSTSHLEFESRFESGNLRKAIQVREYEYDLLLNADINTSHHHQWFYFKVTNTKPRVTYRFNIINCEKPNSQFNYGMQPLMFSISAHRLNQQGWVRAGTKISYYSNNFGASSSSKDSSESFHTKKRKQYCTATFSIVFQHEKDTCYFAYHYPYTYSMLLSDLDRIEEEVKDKDIYYRRQPLCTTLCGNICPLITITGPKYVYSNDLTMDDSDGKKYVVITSRVHPGESNSSWVMRGLLRHLASNHPNAQALRSKFIFKIVPMLNPDGVIHGSHRCSLSGQDLNRQWISPDPHLHPTIHATKSLLQWLVATQRKPEIFCDFHGHSRRKNIFMYGCKNSSGLCTEQVLPRHLDRIAPYFSYNCCSFAVEKSKEATARVVVWKELGVARSYTMESTYCGADHGQHKGRQIGTGDLEEMGTLFCVGLQRFEENTDIGDIEDAAEYVSCPSDTSHNNSSGDEDSSSSHSASELQDLAG